MYNQLNHVFNANGLHCCVTFSLALSPHLLLMVKPFLANLDFSVNRHHQPTYWYLMTVCSSPKNVKENAVIRKVFTGYALLTMASRFYQKHLVWKLMPLSSGVVLLRAIKLKAHLPGQANGGTGPLRKNSGSMANSSKPIQ